MRYGGLKMQDNKSEFLGKSIKKRPNGIHTLAENIRLKTKIYSSRDLAKFLVFQAAFLGIAYVFGGTQMPFGVYPLGIALLCSASKGIFPILSGCILSAFIGGEKYCNICCHLFRYNCY